MPMTAKFSPELQVYLDACLTCLAACERCAACRMEDNVKMTARCVQLDRDCADACAFTARLLMRGSNLHAEACRICAEQCRKMAA
ncbi:four-helix bundle copper-binding protein [Deinococcus oregonensis]|uniref:Four-helix bundle copper-binding protein n=1 Tax=Deinococcus oregonensis TaxID=1805970 RepID=A0ABV6AVM3_9DEIO